MIGRTICFGTLIGGLLLLPSQAEAQAQSRGDPYEDVMQAIERLRADLHGIVKREVETAMHGFVTEERLNAEVDRLTDFLNNRELEIRQLKQEFDNSTIRLDTQIADQRLILNAISTSDSQGNRMVAINNMMSTSPQFRQEMSGAVHDSLQRWGTLRVRNRTGSYQLLDVNRQRLEIPPYTEMFDIRVPVGTLTTELVGQEGAKNWTVTAPDYFQEIVIEPALANRVLVGSPLVYDYPTIFW